jgi:pSer/pThr/pTyr-binding forkhead associated (FHA) protein
MPAQLLALDDSPSILLDKPILLLGRHPECDIQIDSRKISRRHCCIAQVEDYLVVRDLGSTNGVRINGVRVLEGRLTHGDELTIGTSRYQVTWESAHPNGIGVSRKVPTGKAPPGPSPIEDDLLESSDEPVPLPDPDAAAPAGSKVGLPRPVKMEDAIDAPEAETPPPKADALLPEDLDLLPISHSNLPSQPGPPPAESNPSL